jgi:hypothetical protein
VTRILVAREDGDVLWNEGVTAADFQTEHFRRCLADRLSWAVADAEGCAPAATVTTRQPIRLRSIHDLSRPAQREFVAA